MKKIKIALITGALACAAMVNAAKKLNQLYYYNQNLDKIIPITTDGGCEVTDLDVYCQYTLLPGHPDNGALENYQPDGLTEFTIWEPDSK